MCGPVDSQGAESIKIKRNPLHSENNCQWRVSLPERRRPKGKYKGMFSNLAELHLPYWPHHPRTLSRNIYCDDRSLRMFITNVTNPTCKATELPRYIDAQSFLFVGLLFCMRNMRGVVLSALLRNLLGLWFWRSTKSDIFYSSLSTVPGSLQATTGDSSHYLLLSSSVGPK